jgi:hypothetical protein
MRRKLLIALAVVVIVSLGIVVISGRAPALSGVGVANQPCVNAANSCLTFPAISGQNLLGDPFDLPGSFKGKAILVIVPFNEDQQVKAQTWLPLARDLAAADADFSYYSVPVFPSMAAPMRALIRTGMNVTIGDAALRAITITVFLDDRAAFLKALDIANADAMQVFLLDANGVILWRGAGEFSEAQGKAVRALVSGA